jgi:transposase
MRPNSRQRRVHGAEFKAQVLGECRQPGASVAAVALAHGLNVNLVRKWLVGRGLKRAGLAAPVALRQAATAVSAVQFVPVELATSTVVDPPAAGDCTAERSSAAQPPIHIELRRGGAQLTVCWPSSQAQACAAWLSEFAGTVLK